MFFFEGGNSVYTCKFLRASIEIIYIYDYICLPSKSKPHQYCEPPCIVQVLKTLEKIGGSTAPFALQEQYVPAVLAGKGGESDDESSDGDKENKKAPPKKKQKKQKAASKSRASLRTMNPGFNRKSQLGTTIQFGVSSSPKQGLVGKHTRKSKTCGMIAWKRHGT